MATAFTYQVNGASETVAIKAPCRVATTANISLSGLQTIDGIEVGEGDRVVVQDQNSASLNGIYVASAGTWTRAKDFNTSSEIAEGTLVAVSEGSVNGP